MQNNRCIPQVGNVVRATAGRDAHYYVITNVKTDDDNFVYIADGKQRTLNKPKLKNVKHLDFLKKIVKMEKMTDKKIRAELHSLNYPQSEPSTGVVEAVKVEGE
ncbi:MAG: KOW domain-containing RNA-binding protein [Oscillospiraceae bacterium]|jgi:ribosomal protein L14E/L6E/L27E|nr:KOW domain-containing RNA-binding protein [Oscillospiraceae bacterium]